MSPSVPESIDPANGLGRRAAVGAAWAFGQAVLTRATATIVFLIVARLIAPSDFGVVALAAVFTAFAALIADQGFSAAIVQREAIEPEHLNTAFWTSTVIGCGMCVLSLAGAPLIADAFDAPALAGALRALSLSFPLAGLASVPTALLQRELAFRPLAVRGLVSVVVGGVVGVTAAVAGAGYWALVLQQLAASLSGTVLLTARAHWRPTGGISRRHAHELSGFSLGVLGQQIVNMANRRGDDFLIGLRLGDVALGFYSVGYRLLLTMTEVLIRSINAVALPAMARAQSDRDRLQRGFLRATSLASIVAVPIFIGASVLAGDLLRVTVGPGWEDSIPVMQVLALIGPLHAVLFVQTSALLARGRSSLTLRLTVMNAVVNLIGFAIASSFGIVWVAAAYVARGYLLSPLTIRATLSELGIPLSAWARAIVPTLRAAALMTLAVLGFRGVLGDVATPVRLATLTLIGAVTYAATLAVADRATVRDVVHALRNLRQPALRGEAP